MKQTTKENEELALVMDIANKTIGFQLIGVESVADKEFTECYEKQEETLGNSEEKYNSIKPYILAPWEREVVKEILNLPDDKALDYYETYIYNDGDICIKSPQRAWRALAGREWAVNLGTKSVKCVRMN